MVLSQGVGRNGDLLEVLTAYTFPLFPSWFLSAGNAFWTPGRLVGVRRLRMRDERGARQPNLPGYSRRAPSPAFMRMGEEMVRRLNVKCVDDL